MRTYTAFFETADTPDELKSSEGPGTFRLIDGIIAVKRDSGFGFLLNGETQPWIPFSGTEPPEIIRGYILTCEIAPGCKENPIMITRSAKDSLLQKSPELSRALVRVHTRCLTLSPKKGFVTLLRGNSIVIASESTVTADPQNAEWTDSLIVMSIGDAIQIRPAGTIDTTEWVIEYSGIGLVSFTLEAYYNKA